MIFILILYSFYQVPSTHFCQKQYLPYLFEITMHSQVFLHEISSVLFTCFCPMAGLSLNILSFVDDLSIITNFCALQCWNLFLLYYFINYVISHMWVLQVQIYDDSVEVNRCSCTLLKYINKIFEWLFIETTQ